MSTNLFEGDRIQVTRFACGQCRTKGPCFQVTGIGPRNGDYTVVHREDAPTVVKTILKDMFYQESAIDALLAQKDNSVP